MNNLELILNPTVAPVYITATNMVVPVISVSLQTIKNFIIINITKLINITDVILTECSVALNSNIINLLISIIGLFIVLSNLFTTIVVVYNLYKYSD